MAKYKLQLFFELEDSNAGWSEVYYTQQDGWEAAEALGVSLVDKRLSMMPATIKVTYAKAHDLGVPYSVSILKDKIGQTGTFVPGAGEFEGQIEEALLIRYEGASKRPAKKYCHGIGDWARQGETVNFSDPFGAAVDGWVEVFKTNCFVVPANPLSTVKLWEPITNVETHAITIHRVGRPFGAPRGQRRTSKSALTRAGNRLMSSGLATPPSVASGSMVP